MRVTKETSGGIEGFCNNIELMTSIDWGDVFSNITNEETYICTYGKPSPVFFDAHLPHMTNATVVIGVNGWFDKPAYEQHVKKLNPACKLYLKDDTHAKIVLVAPDHVYLSSQNLWPADWFQATVHIKDKDIYEFYKLRIQWEIDGVYNSNIKHSLDMTRMYPSNYGGIAVDTPKVLPAPKGRCSCKCNIAKEVNWRQKFTGVRGKKVWIVTFDIPDEEYACGAIESLLSRGNEVHMTVNTEFYGQAYSLWERVNDVHFQVDYASKLHAKIVFLDNKSVWLSSQNFGLSSWFENTIQLNKCPEAFDYYFNHFKEFRNTHP